MRFPMRALTSVLIATIAATIASGAAGCRGNPQPVVRAEEAPPAKTAPETTPSPAPPTPQEKPPVRDDAPVVVDPGVEDDHRPATLVETARAERKRRASAGEPIAVINDKTLRKYASKGQITVAAPKEMEKAAVGLTPGDPLRDEQYWRGRARDIRERWRQAADDVKKLEQRSTELRQKFYLESDTFLRDNQIKPDWDRVLDKLRSARLDSETAQKELTEFLEAGRTAGVIPGWLREGEDDEPRGKVEKREAAPAAQSIEPPVMEPPLIEPPPGDRR